MMTKKRVQDLTLVRDFMEDGGYDPVPEGAECRVCRRKAKSVAGIKHARGCPHRTAMKLLAGLEGRKRSDKRTARDSDCKAIARDVCALRKLLARGSTHRTMFDGDTLRAVCAFCHASGWLYEDIRHKRGCQFGRVWKALCRLETV